MDTLQTKIKIWFADHLHKKESYTKKEIRPTRDWHIILSVFFLLIIITSFVSLYVYQGAQNGTLFVSGVSEENTPVSIDNILLSKIITTIDTDNKDIQSTYENPVYIRDPSL